MDQDNNRHSVDAAHESFAIYKEKSARSKDQDDIVVMDQEDWEQAKDIFFMLRIPFEVDSSEESREKFSKALLKRNRKRGRYGPQGVFYAN